MKTIFITGASSGIGKATATFFSMQGWNVAASMRNPEKEKELASLPNVSLIKLDVQDHESITSAVLQAIQQFGTIDVLVNNAGYGVAGVFESANIDQIMRQYEVNVFGLMAVTMKFLPYMRGNRSGRIINISSFGGITALPFGAIYNSSKFAVEGFSEALFHEVYPFNIKVKLIEPGSIPTSFSSNMDIITNPVEEYQPMVESFFKRYRAISEEKADASAEDVAKTIYQAATDTDDKLRYVVGNDARFYISIKQDTGEADKALIKEIRERFIDF